MGCLLLRRILICFLLFLCFKRVSEYFIQFFDVLLDTLTGHQRLETLRIFTDIPPKALFDKHLQLETLAYIQFHEDLQVFFVGKLLFKLV